MADQYEARTETLEAHADEVRSLRDSFARGLDGVATNYRIALTGDQFTFAAASTIDAYDAEKDFLLLTAREFTDVLDDIGMCIRVAAANYGKTDAAITRALDGLADRLGDLRHQRSLPVGVLPTPGDGLRPPMLP